MTVRKVVCISYQPLTEKIRSNFYFQELRDAGLEVEYWDLTEVYFPAMQDAGIRKEKIIKLSNLTELEDRLSHEDIRRTIFVVHITYRGLVIRLFKILHRFKCYTVFFARGMLPVSTINGGRLTKVIKLTKKFGRVFNREDLGRYLSDRLAIFYKKIGAVKPYDLIFNSGRYGIMTVGRGWWIDHRKSRTVEINSYDYDSYLLHNPTARLINDRYCVFLDQYLPFHRDLLIDGTEHPASERYFSDLNGLFSSLESQTQTKVVIAAHPLAEKYRDYNYFEGRAVYFGKTLDLVRNAIFVLAHYSTSVNFSVLFGKPVLFVTSEYIRKSIPGAHDSILTFAKSLDSKVHYCDSYEATSVDLTVNSERYQQYKYDFLTSRGIESVQSVRIVLDVMEHTQP